MDQAQLREGSGRSGMFLGRFWWIRDPAGTAGAGQAGSAGAAEPPWALQRPLLCPPAAAAAEHSEGAGRVQLKRQQSPSPGPCGKASKRAGVPVAAACHGGAAGTGAALGTPAAKRK
ncbi:hypothetical protein DV515_00018722 [Chloebia gouldiae]|uniref:Uncharacterized protein n=1 Tax=Chloebia gouldiae TaxID=44316 RepID=A0A3L8Q7I5_CHLGU|nr:hypothetical protein DV515_00018722 [Chloebia gouldiae]